MHASSALYFHPSWSSSPSCFSSAINSSGRTKSTKKKADPVEELLLSSYHKPSHTWYFLLLNTRGLTYDPLDHALKYTEENTRATAIAPITIPQTVVAAPRPVE